MPSIQQNNRAGSLLAEIREDDGVSLERLALSIGVSAEDLRACRERTLALPPLVQLLLARTIMARVPRLATRARRLETQAEAAANFAASSTTLHLTAPAKWY